MNAYFYFMSAFVLCLIVYPLFDFLCKFFIFPRKGDNSYFRDKFGRIQIFHGANVCNASKTSEDMLPWHTEKEYRLFKEHGFNVIRFLIFWEAIEPEKGNYNLEYIAKVKGHIEILNNLGINVVLDIHQDLFNKKFGGNGFPDWALPEKEYKFNPQKEWYKNYFQKAVLKSYSNFWKSHDLKQSYIKMVAFVHEQFKGYPNILGIDVMNEPFPTIPFIARHERVHLTGLYYAIQVEISGKKDKIPLFFEPAIHTSAGIPTYIMLFGGKNLRRFIPHYYPPFCHNKGTYSILDNVLMKIGLRAKAREAQMFSSPFFIGEFGVSKNVKNRFNAIYDFLNISDKLSMSWTWYPYDKEFYSTHGMLDDSGNPNQVMNILSRPFPHYISGTDPVFYNKGDTFCLEYNSKCDIEAPTEIYIPGIINSVNTNTSYTSNSEPQSIHKFYNVQKGKQVIEISWRS